MRYKIQGENMPVVLCALEDGESMICEAGAMSWMSANMQMETKGGGVGKLFGRMISGETMFQNVYTPHGGSGLIAFTSSFPGEIVAVDITPDKPIIIQKKAFLASTPGIQREVFFQKKIGTGSRRKSEQGSSAVKVLSCRRLAVMVRFFWRSMVQQLITA